MGFEGWFLAAQTLLTVISFLSWKRMNDFEKQSKNLYDLIVDCNNYGVDVGLQCCRLKEIQDFISQNMNIQQETIMDLLHKIRGMEKALSGDKDHVAEDGK